MYCCATQCNAMQCHVTSCHARHMMQSHMMQRIHPEFLVAPRDFSAIACSSGASSCNKCSIWSWTLQLLMDTLQLVSSSCVLKKRRFCVLFPYAGWASN